MKCDWEDLPTGGCKCRICGCAARWRIDRNCPGAPSRGLGDTIAKVTAALGIKPCGGCKERQEKLNKLLPYKS